MKTLYGLFGFLALSTLLHYVILKDDYKFATQPNIAEVTYLGRDCGRSCYYYALVDYKGTTQEINIGRINYKHMSVGKSYDFSPSFNWVLGSHGTAYSVEIDVPWYKGIIGKLLSLVINIIILFLIVLEVRDIYINKKNKKTSHLPSFH